MLTVVLPTYNEEKILLRIAEEIREVLTKNNIEYQIVFVDDGSSDSTWEQIVLAKEIDENITGIRFSRNFGKEAAIFAGLAYADGECVAVMDCDLQHPPKTLLEMYRLWEDGYEVIEGIKRSRGEETVLHKGLAKLFYSLMSKATKIDMSKASDFKMIDRKVVDILLKMPERNTFFRAMSYWVGFNCASVEFDVQERLEEKSKWSFVALVKYAMSSIGVYTSAPMQIVTGLGVVCFVLTVILGIQTMVRYINGAALEGFTTVILLILFIGSILMVSLGIIGYYLSKMYEEIKGRPKYIVSKKL